MLPLFHIVSLKLKKILRGSDSNKSVISTISGVWKHLNSRRKIQFCLLILVMLASGLAELLSLGSVAPFLTVLGDPDVLWRLEFVQKIAILVGFTSPNDLLIPTTLLFVAAAILSAAVRMINLWLNGRFAAAVGSDLSCGTYLRTLYQPYDVHVQRNSAEVITATISHTRSTVSALLAFLQVMTAAIVAVGLFVGLLFINWSIALSSAVVFITLYSLLAVTTRRKLQINGQLIVDSSRQQLQSLQEGLGAIRDVLLDSNQNTYIEVYRSADRPLRQLEAKNQYLASFPRFALEAICLASIALLSSLLVLIKDPGVSLFVLMGALALGVQRLLPALQQIYSGWAVLNARKISVDEVLKLLRQPLPPKLPVVEPLQLRQNFRFESVYFRYGSEHKDVVNGLDLEIRSGERIGLIGSTGSGKSTTADLLMGLLKPTHGRVLIDGEDLHEPNHTARLVAWRASIAHVPQTIYLSDKSFAENIAFGVPKQLIDFSRVRKAAKEAQISSFIESSLKGYDTFVGERGVRLSGGQRQRIGIARALYKQASVIVLDEATSALDNSTEDAVMQAVDGLSRHLTLVIIAHRLSTVQRCDRVIRLAKGQLLDDGPPHVVLSSTT